MSEMPQPMHSAEHENADRKEPKSHSRVLAVLILTLAASVVGTVLLLLAVLRFHGTAPIPDFRHQAELLEKVLGLSCAVSVFFGLSALRFWSGRGQPGWSILGTLGACAQVKLLFDFGWNYQFCLSACPATPPPDLLWDAFFLCLACILLGSISAIAVAVVRHRWKNQMMRSAVS
jgi:hypothetical protein